jgi:threonine dehydrogenase-like Zn-dependent dehydrogenase
MFGTFSTNGGMAEFISVPATVLVPLPEDASFVHGALGEPLSVAARTVGKAGIAPEESATIIGAGPIGLMCLILTKARGAKRIGVIDVSEERLALARELGAAWISNPQRQNSTEILSAHLDERGADTVIEAVGIEATVSQAVRLVARGGRLVIVGMLEKRMPVDMHEIVSKEIRIEGSFLYGRQEFQGILGQIGGLRPQLDKIVSHMAPLSQGAEFFARLAAGEANACKVVLTD